MTKISKPKEITAIWFRDDTLDCYIFETYFGYLSTCKTGKDFSQWGSATRGDHLGEEVEWNSIPDELKKHVARRMKED
jgi:hypothetical protein